MYLILWGNNPLPNYSVDIKRSIKKNESGSPLTEIWAVIKNLETSNTIKKLIFWKDEQGIYHDDSSKLPVELRDLVDNAWIEKSRRW